MCMVVGDPRVIGRNLDLGGGCPYLQSVTAQAQGLAAALSRKKDDERDR